MIVKSRVKHYVILTCIALLLLISSIVTFIPRSYAHFSHAPHYNGGGIGVGNYYFYQALVPEFARPGEPTGIQFSIQDNNGNDVHNIKVMVEIYDGKTGDRIFAIPWTLYDTGDFELFYTFPIEGNYQIVLSESGAATQNHGTDPPRSIISSNLNCNCERGIFNVSLTNAFGSIFYSSFFTGAAIAITAIGITLFQTYRIRNRRGSRLSGFIDKRQILQYSIMFSAIAAGVVHLTIYADHSTLNIDYSIFLLIAAAVQVSFGVAYLVFTLSTESISTQGNLNSDVDSLRHRHRKFMTVNLFGLFGTGLLIGLYVYVIIFPPPLSPNNQPEDVDISGVLDKSIEVFTFVGILFLIVSEKREVQNKLVRVNKM